MTTWQIWDIETLACVNMQAKGGKPAATAKNWGEQLNKQQEKLSL